jgi:plastocyanin
MNRAVVTALLVVGLLAGCGGDDTAGGDPDLRAVDFSFDPSALTVAAGEVSLQVANDDDAAHNITMDEFGVDTDVAGGSTEQVTFSADMPGNFAFFCKFHPEQMVGQLTVE